jgi:hypothetical protein
LRLGGLRGKKSTPSAWLGGTGELVEVDKQEQEQLGAGVARASEPLLQRIRPRYVTETNIVECSEIIAAIVVMSLGKVASSSFIPGKKNK